MLGSFDLEALWPKAFSEAAPTTSGSSTQKPEPGQDFSRKSGRGPNPDLKPENLNPQTNLPRLPARGLRATPLSAANC